MPDGAAWDRLSKERDAVLGEAAGEAWREDAPAECAMGTQNGGVGENWGPRLGVGGPRHAAINTGMSAEVR